MKAGIAANVQPTPSPPIAMTTRISHRLSRRNRNISMARTKAIEPIGMTMFGPKRLLMIGDSLLADTLAAENGTRTSAPTTTDAPRP